MGRLDGAGRAGVEGRVRFRVYAIVPTISPWDEENRDAIIADMVPSTMSRTKRGAWMRHVRAPNPADHGEVARRIQHWHDRGYRIAAFDVAFVAEPDEDDDLNALADARQDGPFVAVEIGDLP